MEITNQRVTHHLKIYPEHFSAVCTGIKRAELRKNDRNFKVGDTLHLMETPRGCFHSTGEFIDVTITHIADVGEWMPGYVVLSIARAAKDAEPAVFTDVRNLNHIAIGRETSLIWGKQNKEEGDIPLYRHAPPAPVSPEVLPCPVVLEPGIRFGKGVRTQTMLDALQRRAEFYEEQQALTSEERAERAARIAAFMEALPQSQVQQSPLLTVVGVGWSYCPDCKAIYRGYGHFCEAKGS